MASGGEAMDGTSRRLVIGKLGRASGVSERPVDREPELLVVDGHADFIALHSRTAERVREGMATVPDRDLLDLERQGWTALTKGGDAAAEFYGHVLAEQVLMLLPGGMVLSDRDQALEALRATSWTGFELRPGLVQWLGPDAAVVAYEARARRGDDEYHALFNSTYTRQDGKWKLAVHQQTPF